MSTRAAKGSLLVGTSPPRLLPLVIPEVIGRTVLDVGCGAGIIGYCLRNGWQNTEAGQYQFSKFYERDISNDGPDRLVGVDIQRGSLRRCQRHFVYDLLCQGNVSELPFKAGSFDTVLCLEVIEHLEKRNAQQALAELERVARMRVVVTTPRFALDHRTGRDERTFLKYDGEDIEVLEWVDAERHRCQFSINELRALGYRCGRRDPGRRFGKYLGPLIRFYDNRLSIARAILAVKELSHSRSTAALPTRS